MVGVIVVHLHAPIIPAGDGTVEFEPAAHPGKLGNPLGQGGHIPAGQHPDGECGRRVQHHVCTRNLHGHLDLTFSHSHVGVRNLVRHGHGFHHRVGNIRVAFGGGRATIAAHGHLRLLPLPQRRGMLIIKTNHQHAGIGQPGGEIVENLEIRLRGVKEIQVVRLNIGHHRNVRAIPQQRSIRLVGLGNKAVAAALVRVRARLV